MLTVVMTKKLPALKKKKKYERTYRTMLGHIVLLGSAFLAQYHLQSGDPLRLSAPTNPKKI
jgi:hypothetical protein